MSPAFCPRFARFAAALLCLCAATAACALSSENVVLVVNAASPDSLTLAHDYCALRGIPPNHVVSLTGLPSEPKVTVAQFRDLILRPLLKALDERGLRQQTDCVIYSCGFPYAVDTSADMAGKQFPRIITQPASLTGLTYLYEAVLAADTGYLAPDSNWYYRRLKQQGPPARYTAGERALLGETEDLLRKIDSAQREAREKKTPVNPEVEGWLKDAGATLQALTTAHPSPDLLYNLACVLAQLGKADEAMVALTAAAEAGWWQASMTSRDPDLASVRERPDFKALIEKMAQVVVESEPPAPFHAGTAWGADGQEAHGGEGRQYLLSAMLGYVGGPANTLVEARECLRRARSADGTCPTGTIYYMASDDWARTGPRQPVFNSAVTALGKLGIRGEALSGVLPKDKTDVAGAMIGIASFSWPQSGSTLLPGAFCDHLTSYGGVMTGAGQTLLSEFIRHGAAGACGTVTEPYATPVKFPSPFLHVYYASGCSLVEAFYQSVQAPYQQLLVGDPLCRPWGKAPQVKITGLRAGETVGKARVITAAAPGAPAPVRFELYLDGVRAATAEGGGRLSLEVKALSAGEHEATVVCLAGPLEVPGSSSVRFRK